MIRQLWKFFNQLQPKVARKNNLKIIIRTRFKILNRILYLYLWGYWNAQVKKSSWCSWNLLTQHQWRSVSVSFPSPSLSSPARMEAVRGVRGRPHRLNDERVACETQSYGTDVANNSSSRGAKTILVGNYQIVIKVRQTCLQPFI